MNTALALFASTQTGSRAGPHKRLLNKAASRATKESKNEQAVAASTTETVAETAAKNGRQRRSQALKQRKQPAPLRAHFTNPILSGINAAETQSSTKYIASRPTSRDAMKTLSIAQFAARTPSHDKDNLCAGWGVLMACKRRDSGDASIRPRVNMISGMMSFKFAALARICQLIITSQIDWWHQT